MLWILIPLTSIVFGVALMMFALLFRHRRVEMYHRERMAAIDKGLPVPPSYLDTTGTVQGYLLRALIWLTVGVGISVFCLALYFTDKDADNLAAMTLGIIPAGVGIAYLVIYRLERGKADRSLPDQLKQP